MKIGWNYKSGPLGGVGGQFTAIYEFSEFESRDTVLIASEILAISIL